MDTYDYSGDRASGAFDTDSKSCSTTTTCMADLGSALRTMTYDCGSRTDEFRLQMQAAHEGDGAAWGDIVGRYNTLVYDTARRRLHNCDDALGRRADAEDIVQEVWVKCYFLIRSDKPLPESPEKFRNQLKQTTRQTTIQVWRHNSKVQKRSLRMEISIDQMPPTDETTLAVTRDDPALAAELADLQSAKLRSLPQKQAVAGQSLLDGNSQVRAAADAGVTVRTLHHWWHDPK